MKWAFRVYWQGMRIAFRSMVAYRANFLLSSTLSILKNLGLPLFTVLIYNAGGAVPGWSIYELLLIQSVFTMSRGLCGPLFFSMTWITMDRVREGTYDLMLIRPGPIIIQTLAMAFDPESIGVFFGGLAIFCVSMGHLPAPGVGEIALFIFLFFIGMIVMLGCTLLISAVAFKWVGNSRLFEIYDSVTAFGRYPAGIYPKPLALILSFVLPVGMIAFFPASVLLKKLEPYMLLSVIPCVAFLCAGIMLFQHMVKSYKSAGG